jgi:hypothetical protein
MGAFSKGLSNRLMPTRGVHHKTAERYNSMGTSVARVANKVLFGIETPPSGIDKLDLFVNIPKPYASITSRYTSTDAAYDVKKHIKEKGYHLLIDDRRKIADIYGFNENTTVLVVARTVEAAKQAVTTLGVPKHIYYDYHLRGYDEDVKYEDSTLPFIDWLNTYTPEGGEKVYVESIPFTVVSEHEQKNKIYRLIRDLAIKDQENEDKTN